MTGKWLKLSRLPLSLMNGVAAVGGYLLFPGPADFGTAGALFAGVALLAASASALNQVLERDLDAVMRRTSDRPLPRGELRVASALLIGAGLFFCGAAALAMLGGRVPALLGLATLAWYLAVYTPLKRRSPFALLLGALCGSAAPLIGWCAAGGSPDDFRIVILAGVIYLWQVPHFWLLQRRHAQDYRLAGFPIFTPPAGKGGLAPLCRLWIAAMMTGALLLPAFRIVELDPLLCFVAFFVPLLLTSCKRFEAAAFAGVNLFPLAVTVALCLAK